MDYSGLFKHVQNLKKVLLIAAGRSGSDFFQSLLDGHPEILQFTGIWYCHPFWERAVCRDRLPDLIDEFIWYSSGTCFHIAKFKSFYNRHERWDQLGPDKDDFFEVDIMAFKNHMLGILQDQELSCKNFFLAVNLAYGLATGVDIAKTKLLFYHIHHVAEVKKFSMDFPDFDLICTTREPRNTLVSNVEHFKKYFDDTGSKYTPDFLLRILTRLFEEAEPAAGWATRCMTLKLEDLHLFSREVLEEFCARYGLQVTPGLFESSYHGKKWWGDKLSGRYLDGFNPNITKVNWTGKLFSYDDFLMEFILAPRMRRYGYRIGHRVPKALAPAAALLAFLPMKYELKIAADNLSRRTSLTGKAAALGNSARYYALRVMLYLRFIGRRLTGSLYRADFFIQEKYAP